jgi:hypothetical protein
MTEKLKYKCEQHPDPFDCPDNILYYSPQFDEYGIIIHNGGSSYIGIDHCPWCGTKLPESKRDLWFGRLDSLGYDNPAEQDIPSEFLTEKRYSGKG